MADISLSVVPSREELRQLLLHREGNLAEVSACVLLVALAVHERSVVLELRRGPLQKEIVFDNGVPVDCRSNVATETVGRFLVSTGKLSEFDYQTSLTTAAMRRISFEEVLTERNLISPSNLYRVLQQNLGRKLLDLFSWRSGSYHISGNVPFVETPLRVKVPQLLVTGVTKFESQEKIDDAVQSLGDAALRLSKHPFFHLDEVRLSGDLARVAETLRQGGRRIEQLRESLTLPADDLNRHLYVLFLLGAVTAEEKPAVVQAEKPSVHRPPTLELELEEVEAEVVPDKSLQQEATPPSTPASQVVGEATEVGKRYAASRDDLLKMYLTFRRKDAFELLDVGEDVTPGGTVRAYMRLAESYIPSRFDDRDLDGLREKAQELFLAAARAFAELFDDERRKALIEKRTRRRQDAAVLPPTSAAGAMVDPEVLFKQGRELVEAGKHREGLSYLEMASDWDAQNCAYAAELAYCRFQLLLNTAAHTLKVLKNATRIDPNCGLAFYYTGKVHAALGNQLEAEGYLRKAQTLMPRDRRPVDAVKALKR